MFARPSEYCFRRCKFINATMEEDHIVWKCIYSRHGQGYRPCCAEP